MDEECDSCGVTLSPREATFNDGLCDECQMDQDNDASGDFTADWGQS